MPVAEPSPSSGRYHKEPPIWCSIATFCGILHAYGERETLCPPFLRIAPLAFGSAFFKGRAAKTLFLLYLESLPIASFETNFSVRVSVARALSKDENQTTISLQRRIQRSPTDCDVPGGLRSNANVRQEKIDTILVEGELSLRSNANQASRSIRLWKNPLKVHSTRLNLRANPLDIMEGNPIFTTSGKRNPLGDQTRIGISMKKSSFSLTNAASGLY